MTNAERLATLSDRERAVLSMLDAGKSFKTISAELAIAISTVANHASRIYKKLGVFRKENALQVLHEVEGGTDAAHARTITLARLKDWRSCLERHQGTLQVMRELDALIEA